jgi:hypothetical protein
LHFGFAILFLLLSFRLITIGLYGVTPSPP